MARQKYEKYKTRPDGRKMSTVTTGRKYDDGRPEKIFCYGYTDREVDEARAAALYRIKNNLLPPLNQKSSESNKNVEAYAKSWLETYKSKQRRNTIAMYENIIDKHIVPAIGDLKLTDLSRSICQGMINDRWDKANTCRKIALTMKQLERSALEDGLITSPFWKNISMPEVVTKKKKRALTNVEKLAVQNCILDSIDKTFLYVLYGCGLRREEALALTKDDINIKTHEISVSKVITFDGNYPILENVAKTAKSIRTIPVPDSVWAVIYDYVQTLEPKQLLFSTKAGNMISHSSYAKMWARIQKALSVAAKEEITITAHYFRHNYATMLYYSGISELKAIQLMGHSSMKMIREVYAHLDEEKENTVEKLNAAIKF